MCMLLFETTPTMSRALALSKEMDVHSALSVNSNAIGARTLGSLLIG